MKYAFYARWHSVGFVCLMIGLFHILNAETVFPETNHVEQNMYICLDESLSDIVQLTHDISNLDTNADSPIHLLQRYLESGYLLGLYDEIVNVLEYADWFINQQQIAETQQVLATRLDRVIKQVINGDLNMTEEDVMRSPHLRLLTINERMLVKGKAIFDNIVVMEKKSRVHGKARFYEDVKFKDEVTFEDDVILDGDVIINGTLSVQNEIIGCDLTVGCNISMVESTDAGHGNIIKGGNRFIHNFGTNNTFVGENAGNFTMSGLGNNIGIGFEALTNNITGIDNIAIGTQALAANTIGSRNIAIGRQALTSYIGAAAGNIAIGHHALTSNTIGLANTAVGDEALSSNTTGNDNIAIGSSTLFNNTTGVSNIAVGSVALFSNTTGHDNTAVGEAAMSANTIGISNTAIGSQSLSSNTAGGSNTAIGQASLFNNITGSQNVAVGVNAGTNGLLTGGNNNTFVGYNTGNGLTSGDNNTYLGNGANFSGSESNTIRIGNGLVIAAFINGIFGAAVGVTNAPVIIDNTGKLGTIVSSRYFKRNIEDMTVESERIFDLRPVRFIYKKDATDTTQYGLIAEDVENVFPELVIHNNDGKPLTVRYEVLPVLLLNEIQKMAYKMATMEEALVAVKKQVAEILVRS